MTLQRGPLIPGIYEYVTLYGILLPSKNMLPSKGILKM